MVLKTTEPTRRSFASQMAKGTEFTGQTIQTAESPDQPTATSDHSRNSNPPTQPPGHSRRDVDSCAYASAGRIADGTLR